MNTYTGFYFEASVHFYFEMYVLAKLMKVEDTKEFIHVHANTNKQTIWFREL